MDECTNGMSTLPVDDSAAIQETPNCEGAETNVATVDAENQIKVAETQRGGGGNSGDEQALQDEETRAKTMSLDVAYKSLEMIRKVNLQVEFGREIEDAECVFSLRQARDAPEVVPATKSRLRQWVSEKRVSTKARPCLTCGTPVSKAFGSPEFGRQNITVCVDCANLFSVDYLMRSIVHGKEDSLETRKKKINHVLEESLDVNTNS